MSCRKTFRGLQNMIQPSIINNYYERTAKQTILLINEKAGQAEDFHHKRFLLHSW